MTTVENIITSEIYQNDTTLVEALISESYNVERFCCFSSDHWENYEASYDVETSAGFSAVDEETKDLFLEAWKSAVVILEDRSSDQEDLNADTEESLTEAYNRVSYLESVEASYPEVYQWWSVSSRLAEKLSNTGEIIIDNDFGTWWGRTLCGQAIEMDGTIQKAIKA